MTQYVATVLYEDKMKPGADGSFPPHDIVLAMVGDMTGQKIWDLRKLVKGNPRNGVGNVIKDVRNTALVAGRGMLCVVVDGDRIAEHLGLPKDADKTEITEKLRNQSNAPTKLSVHFLDPNLEGLLRSFAECGSDQSPPTNKNHNSRDGYFNKAAFNPDNTVRNCVKAKQPSLGELVELLAKWCNSDRQA